MPERKQAPSEGGIASKPLLIGLLVVGVMGIGYLWYRSRSQASTATTNSNASSTIPASSIPTIELVPGTTQSYGPVGGTQGDWYDYQLGSDSAINGLSTVLNQIAAESGANSPSGQTNPTSSVTSTNSGSTAPYGGNASGPPNTYPVATPPVIQQGSSGTTAPVNQNLHWQYIHGTAVAK